MSGAGSLRQRLAFEAPTVTRNDFGEDVAGPWEVQHETRGELIYQRGTDAVAAAREAGRQAVKIKLRTGTGARSIKVGWRARFLPAGTLWDVQEVDAVTGRAFVWVVVEGPMP
ncbi:head-tail adaptor protein [Mameliella sediminis]|uniref:head-tail adaptor protein n=1 Tax=Mameliella sediminis TaxID=2836866 RepID=UPI001C44CF4F|nr:head-tail adaptor protein [Mameliella sediminis]MBV7394558.1 head-tail adaptor protein [Mameliella sediminis]